MQENSRKCKEAEDVFVEQNAYHDDDGIDADDPPFGVLFEKRCVFFARKDGGDHAEHVQSRTDKRAKQDVLQHVGGS